jgi:hypothetical protein
MRPQPQHQSRTRQAPCPQPQTLGTSQIQCHPWFRINLPRELFALQQGGSPAPTGTAGKAPRQSAEALAALLREARATAGAPAGVAI